MIGRLDTGTLCVLVIRVIRVTSVYTLYLTCISKDPTCCWDFRIVFSALCLGERGSPEALHFASGQRRHVVLYDECFLGFLGASSGHTGSVNVGLGSLELPFAYFCLQARRGKLVCGVNRSNPTAKACRESLPRKPSEYLRSGAWCVQAHSVSSMQVLQGVPAFLLSAARDRDLVSRG